MSTTWVANILNTGSRSYADEDARPSLLSRVFTALHHSRQLQAAREIDRHRHLIARAEQRRLAASK